MSAFFFSFFFFFARLRKQIVVTFLYTMLLAYSTSPLHIRHRILFLHSTILSLDFCQRRSFFLCVGVCECRLHFLFRYAKKKKEIRDFHKVQN